MLLFEKDGIKMRTIILEPGEEIPPCEMKTRGVFQVLEGGLNISVNDGTHPLSEGFCLVSEPATISMRSDNGSRLLGIQIA